MCTLAWETYTPLSLNNGLKDTDATLTLKSNLHEALKVHNAAPQPYGMHIMFTCCAWSLTHFSISANVSNETAMIPFHNDP